MKFQPKPKANPWGALQRTSERLPFGRARMPVSLAETPPRDGPFTFPATEVALHNPPRTRAKKADVPGLFTSAIIRPPPGRPKRP